MKNTHISFSKFFLSDSDSELLHFSEICESQISLTLQLHKLLKACAFLHNLHTYLVMFILALDGAPLPILW